MDIAQQNRDKASNMFMKSLNSKSHVKFKMMMTNLLVSGPDDHELDMYEIVIAALTSYMQQTQTDGPSKLSMTKLTDKMRPSTVDKLSSIGQMIMNSCMSDDPEEFVGVLDIDMICDLCIVIICTRRWI